MEKSIFFYDLETSGLSPRNDRIMQFAGQRVDLDLNPIGEPVNILVKITPDILPSPDAILVTGITPQKTLEEGISEADFLKFFYDQIAIEGTVFAGFNNVRFDDEFIRFLNYRNFYEAYEWQWSDGRGKWDMLDVVRMTRALRPQGIEWPNTDDGKPTNRLELITATNNLEHSSAHDALSDVFATIAVAKLIKSKQPKLFDYLYKNKDKKQIENLVKTGKPFVYTSGAYKNEYQKTTVAMTVGQHPEQKGTFIVFDLRHKPDDLIVMTPVEIADAYENRFAKDQKKLPIKLLQSNKCPAVAPVAVLTDENKLALSLDIEDVTKNYQKIAENSSIIFDKLTEVFSIINKNKKDKFSSEPTDVDSQLYDGFFNSNDKNKSTIIHNASPDKLADLSLDFDDPRLNKLLLLYKARQYAISLSDDEEVLWREYLSARLVGGSPGESRAERFFKRLEELVEINHSDPDKVFLLQELQLYAQGILPQNY